MAGRAKAAWALFAGIAATGLAAQTVTVRSEKEAMVSILSTLQQEYPKLRLMPRLDLSYSYVPRDLSWLRDATSRWEPASAEEGRALRLSLEQLNVAMQKADAATDLALLQVILDDIHVKAENCRAMGLNAQATVEARTKRQGLEEVKGLEVWYLEKFLTADPAAKPHRFDGFSSPTMATLVPGRYVFWSRSPVDGKLGEKLDLRVTGSQAVLARKPSTLTLAIEVLAP